MSSYSSSKYSGYTSPYLKRSDSQSSAGRRDSAYATRYNPPSNRYGDVDKYSKYRLNTYKKMSEDVPEAVEIKEEEPVVEEAPEEAPEVLHESDVEDFKEEEKFVESEPVIEEQPETEPEPEIEEEVIHEAQEHEIEITQDEFADEEVSVPVPEPERLYSPEPTNELKPVSPTPRRRSMVENDENKETPKKLTSGVWPPVEDSNAPKQVVGTEERPKKKLVSDLIARFNTGTVENEGCGKSDGRYKQEYGATGQTGKINSEVFH